MDLAPTEVLDSSYRGQRDLGSSEEQCRNLSTELFLQVTGNSAARVRASEKPFLPGVQTQPAYE